MRPSPIPFQVFLAGITLANVVLGLTGCANPFAQKEEPIKEPPFIPAPEAPAVEAKEEIPALYVGAFADMMEYGDQGRHNPKLVEAVAHAIRIGVLKPNGIQDRFNAQNPVSFGEFRTWTLAYQAAAAGTSRLKPETPATAKNQPRELATIVSRTEPLNSPMNPAKLTMLSPEPRFGEHTLAPNRPLTREELCALYILLAQKQDKVNTLSPEAVEEIVPDSGSLNGDESLSMFKDYPAISQWAKPYVGLAYQDAILQKVFNLSGTRLTIEEGFNPSAIVNREEAILLLNQLYGHVKSPAPIPSAQPAQPVKTITPMGDPGLSGTYIPGESKTPALPLKNLKTLKESSPLGTRNAQRIERAE